MDGAIIRLPHLIMHLCCFTFLNVNQLTSKVSKSQLFWLHEKIKYCGSIINILRYK